MGNEIVLIVEDEFLIACSLCDWLERAGYRVAGVAKTAAEVLAAIDSAEIDVAIVDLKLADGPADAVARTLRDRGIPFAACTGYPPDTLPPEYADAVIVPKPCDAADVVTAVRKLLAARIR